MFLFFSGPLNFNEKIRETLTTEMIIKTIRKLDSHKKAVSLVVGLQLETICSIQRRSTVLNHTLTLRAHVSSEIWKG